MNRKSLSHPQSFRKTSLALAIAATLALPAVFAAPGDPVGGEFQVSTTATASFSGADVAVDADGDTLVVWTTHRTQGDGYDINAQRYNSAGVAVGTEFSVKNHSTNAFVFQADVAMDADGDALVTWTSKFDSGQGFGPGDIFAQRYNSAGVAVGSEFRVNTTTDNNDQEDPAVAMDADGDAWVTWFQRGNGTVDGDAKAGVYAQRYNSAGVAIGTEFFVSAHRAGAAVALDADGDVWVTYEGAGDIYARRYNSAGVAVGGEFRVNTFTTDLQFAQSVAVDPNGNALVVWTSRGQDGSGEGIYAQRYNNAGVVVGAEFRVNTSTAFQQQDPAVAVDPDGEALVVWTGISGVGTDSLGLDIYAQRYAGPGAGVICDGLPATQVGTPGPDTLIGTSSDDVIAGLGGDDVIQGRGGNDRLCGDTGWDRLLGGFGNDRLIGGSGIDTAEFGGNAGVGASLASGTAGGEGSDTLIEIENLTGTAFSDNLAGNGGPNLLRGAGGSDILRGLGGNDRLLGGSANDNLDGGAGTGDVCDGQDGTSDTASNCETVQNVP